jgi:hypothetical protein
MEFKLVAFESKGSIPTKHLDSRMLVNPKLNLETKLDDYL